MQSYERLKIGNQLNLYVSEGRKDCLLGSQLSSLFYSFIYLFSHSTVTLLGGAGIAQSV
jgi:hypothetical protein